MQSKHPCIGIKCISVDFFPYVGGKLGRIYGGVISAKIHAVFEYIEKSTVQIWVVSSAKIQEVFEERN